VRLAELYSQPRLTLSVEFFPPKTEKGEENLFSEIELIKRIKPAFCSVTYGAGGSTREKTVDLVETIHSGCGLDVMCHLTVVGQSKDDARAVLKKLQGYGIENILALGGDPPQGMSDWQPHPDGFHHAIELVREAVAMNSFSVAVAGFPEVAILSNEKVDGKFIGVVAAGDFWHSDQSYRKQPSLATLLYAHKLPKHGGETEFADMHGAYENLPDDIKKRIDGRMGIHQRSKLGNPRVAVTREGGEEYYKRQATTNVLHPMVRTHPVSGRKGLYVSPRFTVGIEGMDDAEAQPLLDTLFAFQTAPENVYRHKWTLGDFVMWDNRSLNHQACGGYAMDDIRLMHRTSTIGDEPFA